MKLFLQIEILLILKDQKVPLNLGVVVSILESCSYKCYFFFHESLSVVYVSIIKIYSLIAMVPMMNMTIVGTMAQGRILGLRLYLRI